MVRLLWLAVIAATLSGAAVTFDLARAAGSSATSAQPMRIHPAREVSCPSGDLIAVREVFVVSPREGTSAGGTASPAIAPRDIVSAFLARDYPRLPIGLFTVRDFGGRLEYRITRNGSPRMVVHVVRGEASWQVTGFTACNSVLVEGVRQ